MDKARSRANKSSIIAIGALAFGASALTAYAAFAGAAEVAKYASVATIGLGGATIGAFLLLYSRPLRRVARAQRELADGRVAALLAGVTELFVGNLTARAEPGPSPAPARGWGALAAIGEQQEELDRAIGRGIADFNGITADPIRRFCFVGDNSYQEGCIAAREAIRIAGGRGKVAVLLTIYRDVNHALRAKGFVNTVRAEAPAMRIVAVEENDTAGDMRKETDRILRGWLKEHPDLDLVYFTEGWSPIVAARIIAERPGKKPKIVAYDVWEDNIEGMELGVVEALLEQNAYLQGYDPLIHLYNYVEHGKKPIFPKLVTVPVVVTRENVGKYWDPREKKRVVSAEERARVERPLPRKGSGPVRLAFIAPDQDNFWRGIMEGARAAAAELAPLGVEVEAVHVYEQGKDMVWGAARHFVPHVEGFVARGFDGIALTISDPALVPTVNAAAARGAVFCTYNSEPFNFREIIESIYAGLSTLVLHSESLAAAASESSRSTALINQTMVGIARDAKSEGEEVGVVGGLMDGLARAIAEAAAAMGETRASMGEAAAQSKLGGEAVGAAAAATEGLIGVYKGLETGVAELREKIGRIGSIVETIQGFAEETNVLAINAAIQAARAGEQGKGFSVVAAAVRGLAESSRRAASDIAAIVHAAEASMAAAGATVGEGEGRVAENLRLAERAREALGAVMRTSEAAAATLGAIGGRLSGVEEAGARVREATAVLLRITEANNGRVAEISNSTAEMNLQEQELSRTATELLSMAKNQEVLLSQLTLSRK